MAPCRGSDRHRDRRALGNAALQRPWKESCLHGRGDVGDAGLHNRNLPYKLTRVGRAQHKIIRTARSRERLRNRLGVDRRNQSALVVAYSRQASTWWLYVIGIPSNGFRPGLFHLAQEDPHQNVAFPHRHPFARHLQRAQAKTYAVHLPPLPVHTRPSHHFSPTCVARQLTYMVNCEI